MICAFNTILVWWFFFWNVFCIYDVCMTCSDCAEKAAKRGLSLCGGTELCVCFSSCDIFVGTRLLLLKIANFLSLPAVFVSAYHVRRCSLVGFEFVAIGTSACARLTGLLWHVGAVSRFYFYVFCWYTLRSDALIGDDDWWGVRYSGYVYNFFDVCFLFLILDSPVKKGKKSKKSPFWRRLWRNLRRKRTNEKNAEGYLVDSVCYS